MNNKKTIKKAIGIYQLITGIFGIIILIANTIALGPSYYNEQIVMLQLILGIFLYGSLAWAGYSLVYEYQKAFKMSVSIQVIQIPVFEIKGLLYKFSASAFLFFGISEGRLIFHSTIKPIDFAMTTNLGHEHLYGIYLVPLFILILLIRLKKEIRD